MNVCIYGTVAFFLMGIFSGRGFRPEIANLRLVRVMGFTGKLALSLVNKIMLYLLNHCHTIGKILGGYSGWKAIEKPSA